MARKARSYHNNAIQNNQSESKDVKRFRTENVVPVSLRFTQSIAEIDIGFRKNYKDLDVLLEESEEKQHPLRDLAPPVIEDDELI
jgi:hypothetical protein